MENGGINTMYTLKIFIASSSDLEEERKELKLYIDSLNNQYADYDVRLETKLWEYMSKTYNDSRKQNDYNNELLDSDMVIFMFGSRIGRYTKEEFDVAVQNKRNNKNPRHIVTYFKDVTLRTYGLQQNDFKELKGVLDLKNYIAKELEQIHVPFTNISDLQFQVSDEINRIIIESFFKDSYLTSHNNVLMLPRQKIHERFSIDSRLHIRDGLYSEIRQIRLLNICSNFIISPNAINLSHDVDDIRISDAIERIIEEGQVVFDMILTEPNQYNLKDVNTKIACRTMGSSKGQIYSSLDTLYKKLKDDTIFSQLSGKGQFAFYLMKISMPYAIFNVEFSQHYEKFNHVKVDLYSPMISNENDRRSFIIWQKDDPDNYKFFIDNFDSIKANKEICIKVNKPKDLEKYGVPFSDQLD